MSDEQTKLATLTEELATISLALSVIAVNQVGAEDADGRKRHELASKKALDLLLNRIEMI